MELRVFDKALEPLGIVDEIASLLWTIKYFDVGTFNLLAPVTDNNSNLLSMGNIIIKHDGKKEVEDGSGGIWRRAAQIMYVHITKDERGQEQIEAQGFMLSKWLSKRVVTPQLVTTATCQQIINALVANNCGANATTKRKFTQFTALTQADLGGSSVDYSNELYVDLGSEVKDVAVSGKLGYDILVNERDKLYGFYLYKGDDLTAGNSAGNPPCIFSRDFDNVNGQEYEDSIESYKNFTYVQGAADEVGAQPVVTVDGGNKQGLELDEVFIDASDISRSYESGGTSVPIPLNTYLAMLRTRGATELENYGERMNFVSTINTASNLRFKDDFNLGDRITCLERSWGLRIDARITEVQEVYQKGQEEIQATFGESLPTLVEKIKRVR